jgi:hypothetical protein
MFSSLALSAVDRDIEPRSGQTKDYRIGICCFSAKHAALRRKSKDWLARNQNNVSEWNDMQVNFQWDDDEVRSVLDQHAELDFYSASSLK